MLVAKTKRVKLRQGKSKYDLIQDLLKKINSQNPITIKT